MMLRNGAAAPLPDLQKTYDESYLTCSTAVYYESQGDEIEAMRCWRLAVEQINDHDAKQHMSTYLPNTETELALAQSLHQLELQCKERIDLLEALRLSRLEETAAYQSRRSSDELPSPEPLIPDARSGRGAWIDSSTITTPIMSRRDSARPPLPPRRPSLATRSSSERAVLANDGNGPLNVDMSSPRSRSSPHRPLAGRPRSRTPSRERERYTMRTTLRPGKTGSDRPSRATPRASGEPGASKAASLAWTATSATNKTPKSGQLGTLAVPAAATASTTTSKSTSRSSHESPRRWDSHSRRLLRTHLDEDDDKVVVAQGRHSLDVPRREPPGTPTSRSHNPRASAASKVLDNQAESSAEPRLSSYRRSRPQSQERTRQGTRRTFSFENLIVSSIADERARGEPRSQQAINNRFPMVAGRDQRQQSISPKRHSRRASRSGKHKLSVASPQDSDEDGTPARERQAIRLREQPPKIAAGDTGERVSESSDEDGPDASWKRKKAKLLKNLPPGLDKAAAQQILNEIVVQGDEVFWSDVAGLEIAKSALREAVVYPFLRPDLFKGLREPARGMLLFGPPGTGKTMLARAVATESHSTFFSISASSLTSKYLGESEKLVRALFGLAKVLAPSIIFVDEIDSLLSQRSGSGEHEATRRIKTEFLIQWSDLQRAAAGRDTSGTDRGDPNRVLVLAATNLPWAIDEAARRRFVRRQYIPLPEAETRTVQIKTLLSQQKHSLNDADIVELVRLTDGFSGSDITALAKDGAMGPLRSLGEALLHMRMDDIRPITLDDFKASLTTIRPSVSQSGLKEHEDWAREFGERGG